MTADESFDQLEPLLSEALTVLDRHTYQLKQLNSAVSQLADVATQQGDNISFLLREQLVMKTQQDQMDGKLDQILQLLQKPGQ